MEVRSLGVVGAGQMGSGIAQVVAQAGVSVLLHDIEQDYVKRGLDRISRNLDRMAERGRFSPQERQQIQTRIATTTALRDFAGVDFVIEAVSENEGIKVPVFRELNGVCRPAVIFASNTSSISITRMGAESGRADRFIGMHFMNPVPAMKLVEIVRGLATSEATYEAAKTLAGLVGKTTITSEDVPGFIVNRILLPMINEAIYALYEGVGGVTDIDAGMKLGCNHPMGPLELADLVGLDTCLAIMEVMHEGLGDDKYRACPLLKKYVDGGYLGRKSGRGFYNYDEQGNPIAPSRAQSASVPGQVRGKS